VGRSINLVPWSTALCMAGLWSGAAAGTDLTLTAVYGDFVTPPAIIRDNDGTPTAGYLLDIYHELSKQLGMTLQLKALPRTEIARALLKSDADIYCRANPAWYPEPLLRWSPPLFAYADVLLSRQPMEDLATLALHKAVVATVTGYKYPQLEVLFREGRLLRRDYLLPAAAAAAFLAEKTDTIVLSEIEAHYLLPVGKLAVFELTLNQLHCIYSPRLKPLQRQLLDNYISARASHGDFKALLQKYGWQMPVEQAPK
jgi:polar amino acid transport system substrate-binding protein